ncbi:hypothetical protein SSX86_027956 [Deinandra increscens subsp. villosa]|uniref:F-box domain-containing protein n=1 Tax=Deinandra increscens subsp. villosa TaxID=3103831 RepID=A0AAP0GKC1_9ASTR
MVNTRAQIRKTQSILKICFSKTSIEGFDHQSTRSGALIGSIDDLLIEILLRLPVTSILRFKSVSKHWRWLLSHRRFTLLYDNLKKSPGLFSRNIYVPFDVENQSTPPFHTPDFCFDPCGIQILQSCNGLLLCSGDRVSRCNRKYYVYNPTTKQVSIIPSVPGGQKVRRTICFMGLAFHQTDCVHYKILCIRWIKPEETRYQIQIYLSETGKWKITGESFSSNYFTKGVYWNGAIHWTPSCQNPFYFKVDVERLQVFPVPVPVNDIDGAMSLYFGESRGHLHLVEAADDDNDLHLNVYEMLIDHSGWFVKYQVELDELPGAFPEMIRSCQYRPSRYYYKFNVVDVVRGEKEEDTFMVLSISEKIIRYNVHNKSFKKIISTPTYPFCVVHEEVHRYIETLSSF